MQKDPRLLKIGKRIRKLREEARYSQEAFASEAGLDRAYYGGVERGERNISSLNLILIATTLKVKVGELFPTIKILKSCK